MASPIIAAIRHLDLKESVLHTAQELAHRASIYGVARVSLRYLAWKCHCCKQTIINHLRKLVELKIIRKQVIWIKGNYCEVNVYTFVITWDKSPTKGGSQISGPNLPPLEREKNSGILEELEHQRKFLRVVDPTPGSLQWEAVQEKIAALLGLLAARSVA